MNLTPKQLHILTRIRDLRIVRGCSPTMQELADELNVSKVTVFEHVEALIKKGALLRQPNKARSLVVSPEVELPDADRLTRLPLVGTIAAGLPIEAVEDRQHLDLEALFSSGSNADGNTFVLRVSGDSMIDEQIRDKNVTLPEAAKPWWPYWKKAKQPSRSSTVTAVGSGSNRPTRRMNPSLLTIVSSRGS